jgi:hypothetical protein
MPTSKKCYHCGVANDLKAKKCQSCSSELGGLNSKGLADTPAESRKKMLIGIGVIGILALVGRFVIPSTPPATDQAIEKPVLKEISVQDKINSAKTNKEITDLLIGIASNNIQIDTKTLDHVNKYSNNPEAAQIYLIQWLTIASNQLYNQGENLTESVDVSHKMHENFGTRQPDTFERLDLKAEAAKMRIAARNAQNDIQILRSLQISKK